VEQALQRPEFADFWALKWSDLLRTRNASWTVKEATHFITGFAKASLKINRSINSCATFFARAAALIRIPPPIFIGPAATQ